MYKTNITHLFFDIEALVNSIGEKISLDITRIIADICSKKTLKLVLITNGAWCLTQYLIDDFHSYCQEISFIEGLITEFGTKIQDTRGRVLWGNYLSEEKKGLILSQIKDYDYFFFHGKNNGYYLYSPDTHGITFWRKHLSQFGDNSFIITSQDFKYLTNLFFLDKVSLIRTSAYIEAFPNLQRSFNLKLNLCELCGEDSKEKGVLQYLKIHKLSSENILFVGENNLKDLLDF